MWVKCAGGGPLVNVAHAYMILTESDRDSENQGYGLMAYFPGGLRRLLLHVPELVQADRALSRLHELLAKGAQEIDAIRDLADCVAVDDGGVNDGGGHGYCPACRGDFLLVGDVVSGYRQCVNCRFKDTRSSGLLSCAEQILEAFVSGRAHIHYLDLIARLEAAVRAVREPFETARSKRISAEQEGKP